MKFIFITLSCNVVKLLLLYLVFTLANKHECARYYTGSFHIERNVDKHHQLAEQLIFSFSCEMFDRDVLFFQMMMGGSSF